jgi:hypothetical protein
LQTHDDLRHELFPVMLSEALRRNAKHEARLSNISGLLPLSSRLS